MPGRALRLLAPVAAGLATSLLAAGCAAPSGLSPAGFAAPSARLTLGVPDGQGFYSWTLAEEFARRVGTATDGTVEIDLQRSEEVRSWNQALAERVIAGDFDLGLVAARAWDVLGVSSLTALYVPFLVRDEEHLDAVATSDVADDLLAGVAGTGVTPLALVPGGMRHYFADGDAPVVPADLEGAGVRAMRSTTVWSTIDALGGRPDDPNGPEVFEAVRAARITVTDSMFALADGPFLAPAVAGDVAPYPLAYTLVVNDDRLSTLSPGQRGALREAARATTEWAARTRVSDAEEAARLCERVPRAKVVLAGDDAVRAWHDASADVTERLLSDPEVAAIADRIGSLADQAPPAPAVRACRGTEADSDSTPSPEPSGQVDPNVPADFPEGVYRKEVTADELIDLGVNARDAHEHEGVWMAFIRDGRWGPEDDVACPGSTYEIVDERIVVTLGPQGEACGEAAGQVLFSAGWHLDGDRLSFTDVRSGHGADRLIAGIFGSAPWVKLE